MVTPIVQAADAVRLLTEVVEAHGHDYRYPPAVAAQQRGLLPTLTCHYIADGAPSCLIGHALVAAGYSVDDLQVLEHPDGTSWGADSLGDYLPGVTGAAETVFQAAQEVQDDAEPWGAALRAAEQALAALDEQDAVDEAFDAEHRRQDA